MLLVVKIKHELNFNEHITSLCTMAIQKLDAALRIAIACHLIKED